MKIYTKVINGKTVFKQKKDIIVKKEGLATYNPPEEMILNDGWAEYIKPEPTAEELLRTVKQRKLQEISDYDSSDEVNQLFVGGAPIWLDKATRTGLLLRFQAEKAQGLISTALWYDGTRFPLLIEDAINMLYAIELYASQCYDNTQRHFAAIKSLDTAEGIENYDYTTGYPEKLNF